MNDMTLIAAAIAGMPALPRREPTPKQRRHDRLAAGYPANFASLPRKQQAKIRQRVQNQR